MPKYDLEFVLHAQNTSVEELKECIAEYAEAPEVILLPQQGSVESKDFKIHLNTSDPTVIFDLCSQFGRIKSVKVEEKQS